MSQFSNSLFTSLASEGGSERELYDEFVGMLSEAKPEGLSFTHVDFLDEDHGSTLILGGATPKRKRALPFLGTAS